MHPHGALRILWLLTIFAKVWLAETPPEVTARRHQVWDLPPEQSTQQGKPESVSSNLSLFGMVMANYGVEQDGRAEVASPTTSVGGRLYGPLGLGTNYLVGLDAVINSDLPFERRNRQHDGDDVIEARGTALAAQLFVGWSVLAKEDIKTGVAAWKDFRLLVGPYAKGRLYQATQALEDAYQPNDVRWDGNAGLRAAFSPLAVLDVGVGWMEAYGSQMRVVVDLSVPVWRSEDYQNGLVYLTAHLSLDPTDQSEDDWRLGVAYEVTIERIRGFLGL